MSAPSEIFKSIRLSNGLSHEQIAAILGISSCSYYDCESYEDEITYCLHISDIFKYCKFFNILPGFLFGILESYENMNAKALMQKIDECAASSGITIHEFFHEKIGWKVIAPEDFISENIEFIQDVSREVGLDFAMVLNSLFKYDSDWKRE